jgi:predicted transcriptional regulator
MSARRSVILVRLKPEDKEIIRRIAQRYDIAESDVVRMAIREYAEKRRAELASS